jgi:hypothetical protein
VIWNSAAKAVLVPPRPNLGPEPLPRSLSITALVLAGLLVAAVAATVLARLVRFRRQRRDRRDTAPFEAPAGPFDSRGEQMAAWSLAIRAALAARFGGHWHARTTEEIAADPIVAERLGPELATALVRFLAVADLAKFDDRDGLQPPLPDPDFMPGWLSALDAPTSAPGVPSAGAMSRIKGK